MSAKLTISFSESEGETFDQVDFCEHYNKFINEQLFYGTFEPPLVLKNVPVRSMRFVNLELENGSCILIISGLKSFSCKLESDTLLMITNPGKIHEMLYDNVLMPYLRVVPEFESINLYPTANSLKLLYAEVFYHSVETNEVTYLKTISGKWSELGDKIVTVFSETNFGKENLKVSILKANGTFDSFDTPEKVFSSLKVGLKQVFIVFLRSNRTGTSFIFNYSVILTHIVSLRYGERHLSLDLVPDAPKRIIQKFLSMNIPHDPVMAQIYRRVLLICYSGGIPTHLLDKFDFDDETQALRSKNFDRVGLNFDNASKYEFNVLSLTYAMENLRSQLFTSSSEYTIRSLFWDAVIGNLFCDLVEPDPKSSIVALEPQQWKHGNSYKLVSEWQSTNLFKIPEGVKIIDLVALTEISGIEYPILLVEVGKDEFASNTGHKDFSKLLGIMSISCIKLAHALEEANKGAELSRIYGIWIGSLSLQLCVAQAIISDDVNGKKAVHASLSFFPEWKLDLIPTESTTMATTSPTSTTATTSPTSTTATTTAASTPTATIATTATMSTPTASAITSATTIPNTPATPTTPTTPRIANRSMTAASRITTTPTPPIAATSFFSEDGIEFTIQGISPDTKLFDVTSVQHEIIDIAEEEEEEKEEEKQTTVVKYTDDDNKEEANLVGKKAKLDSRPLVDSVSRFKYSTLLKLKAFIECVKLRVQMIHAEGSRTGKRELLPQNPEMVLSKSVTTVTPYTARLGPIVVQDAAPQGSSKNLASSGSYTKMKDSPVEFQLYCQLTKFEVFPKVYRAFLNHRTKKFQYVCERMRPLMISQYEVNLDGLLCEHYGDTIFQCLRFGLNCLYGLHILHSDFKIVHSDISPWNIHYSTIDGMWKLDDFDHSMCLEESLQTVRKAGTIGFISPESESSGIFTPESDVYSLGRVIINSVYPAILKQIPEIESFEIDPEDSEAIETRDRLYHWTSDFERVFTSMARVNPEKRPSVTTALQSLYNIIHKFNAYFKRDFIEDFKTFKQVQFIVQQMELSKFSSSASASTSTPANCDYIL